ncbi:MAG TPA: DUF4350 domain-containing protein [Vicinamibacteria bacterium]|nr:DUF4350 domain-containing protein [Vicinamibacteria bacterium]
MSEGPFSRRALVWLISISVASFATWLVVGLIAPEPTDVESAEADAYSRSAIGHRAFVELLRAQNVPVMVSRFDSGGRAGEQALLVVAEPRLDVDAPTRSRKLQQMLRSARHTLLVLPKRQGHEDSDHRGWLARAELVPPTAISRVLQDADIPAGYALPSGDGIQQCDGVPANPTLQRPQLIRATGDGLTPLIACTNGWLLAEREDAQGGRVLVLSDPDVLANHGLGDGDNATVAWAILGYARQPGQAVVLDETLHGHERVPSLWRELFTFPLAAASLQGALVVGFLVWAGLARFGAPLPVPVALSAGKGVLVDNTAALLRLGGHSAYTLGRYLESLKYEVARTLHAPAGLAPPELRERLRRLGRRRRVTEDLGALETSVARLRDEKAPAPAAVLAVARRVHRWRQEMLGGPERAGGG